MKPEILVITPLYAPTLAALEREYTVHRLWEARQPDAFVRDLQTGEVTRLTGAAGAQPNAANLRLCCQSG